MSNNSDSLKRISNSELKFKNSTPDYELVREQISVLESFSRISNESFFVRDLIDNSYRFLHGDSYNYSGYSLDEIIEFGTAVFAKLITDEDASFVWKQEIAFYNFLRNLDPHRRKHLVLMVSYFFTHRQGYKFPVNVHLSPLLFDDYFNVWMLLGKVSLSTRKNNREAYIELMDTGERFVLDIEKECFVPTEKLVITYSERIVLSYSARGYSEKELASELKVSVNTIKSHKTNIYKKLNVNNITEAYVIATNQKLM